MKTFRHAKASLHFLARPFGDKIFSGLIVFMTACSFATSEAIAYSALIEGLADFRQQTSGGFKEVYYDVVQYWVYSDGSAPSYVQRINGLYFNDGGTYGTASDKQVYAAKVDWINWANGKWYIRQSQRPNWLPVGTSKFWPFNSIDDGEWYYEVLPSDGGGGSVGFGLVDAKLLRDIAGAVLGNYGRGLDKFRWKSLRRLSSNQIRTLFRTLGSEAESVTGNAEIAGLLTELGDQMGNLLDQQLSMQADSSPENLWRVAVALNTASSGKRKLVENIAGIYTRMFNSATRGGMRAQLLGFSTDFERTLRNAQGDWTMRRPQWNPVDSYGMTIFWDLRGPNGKKLYFDSSNFPFVRVFTQFPIPYLSGGSAPGEQSIYFLHRRGMTYGEKDQFPELADSNTFSDVYSMRREGFSPDGTWPQAKDRQVFRIAATGKWFVMATFRSPLGQTVVRYWEYQPSTRNWVRVSNPFHWD